MSEHPRRVLITNDDGPPSAESPYVFGLFLALRKLGWDVTVVLPATQKSWIGKAFQIRDRIKGTYYYPREPDGLGEASITKRPLKDGEVAEWILLDATPATCTNIAVHNLFPGVFDLVISGPNYGRNTSAAFALSSGTIGAAMSASLTNIRSIAISYGNFQYPPPKELLPFAHELSLTIIQALWKDWGRDEELVGRSQTGIGQLHGLRNGEVDLYAVNIPIVPALQQEGNLKIAWTRLWRNGYGLLFKPATDKSTTEKSTTESGNGELDFVFSPVWGNLLEPALDSLPTGSDAWAIHQNMASVTPLRASFGEPGVASLGFASEVAKVQDTQWLYGGRIWDIAVNK